MNDKELLRQMLGITAPWIIKSVELDVAAKRLGIEVECTQEHWADEQGRKLPIHGYEQRQWRHLDAFQFETVIHGRIPRVRYPEGHEDDTDGEDGPPGGRGAGEKPKGRTALVTVPWAERYSRFTVLFERFAIEVMQACKTLADATRLLSISWDEAQRIMDRAVARGLTRRQSVTMPHLGIDEKSFGRGHDYATVLLDLSRECVHEIGPERTKEATMDLLTRAIPDKEQREEVSAVAMDMSAAFAAAVKEVLPSAAIVYDRFHVSKLLNAAVDQVRRAEHKRQSAAGNDSLKNSRYLWLSAPENLSDEKRTEFESVFRRNAVVGRAWTDRENFARFWECRTEAEGRQFFDRWEAGVFKRKKLEAMKQVAKTLRRHLEGLINYITHPLTNALAEGLNSLIAVLKGAARGLKNFANFRTRVLFYLGKLDLYPA
jgi:transposase